MKKVIAIALFSVMTLSTAWVMTGCEPGQKTTNPDMKDSSVQNNNSSAMDTTVVADSTHLKNPGK